MVDHSQTPQAERAYALAGELRALIGKLRRRMREQSNPGDLTSSQKSVLLRLEREGPATVSSLARAEGMRPQSMSAAVAALDAAGLITGVPDPNDGRQNLLSLTDACREMMREGRAARQDWLFGVLQARLSVPEQEKLGEAIELLRRIADD